MLNNIRHIILDSYRIALKDLLELVRDKMMLFSFIVWPLFMLLVTGYVFPSQGLIRDLPMGIINQDSGQLSSLIIQPLSEMKTGEENTFYLTAVADVDDAREQIRRQQLNGAILIPANFSDKIANNEQAMITIIIDQTNPQLAATLTTMLEKVMNDAATLAGTEKVARLLPAEPDAEALVQPFSVQSEGIVPGKPNYFQFVAPGVICMIVIFAVLNGLAASIAREREDGTIDGIMAAPISRLTIILGKSFSQATRGIVQAAIVLLLAVIFFNVVIQGNFLLVVFLLLLSVFSFIGLGVLISSTGRRQETATAITMTLQFPMLFLSGVFFPIQQMPQAIQLISKIIPLTYAVQAMRKVIILGAGFTGVLTEIIIMAIFGVVMLTVAIYTFNRVMTR